MMKPRADIAQSPSRTLARAAWASVIAVVFLIFVGGIVRSSGAGLGCPDWPKCWGLWWPPPNLDNVDLSKVLEAFRARNPELTEADLVRLFDPVHLWIEYINRLIGVLIGFFVIGTVAFAAAAVRGGRAPRVALEVAFLALVVVGYTGWLGAIVVRSQLAPEMVTAHLACAFFLLVLLLYIALAGKDPCLNDGRVLPHLTGILSGAIAVQVIIGSQVRGGVDTVMKAGEFARGDWLAQPEVSILDHAHRAFSWIVLLILGMLAIRVFRASVGTAQKQTFVLLLIAIVAQLLIGIGLAYGGLPPVLQALHVGVPGMIVCSLAIFWFVSAREVRRVSTPIS